MLKPLFGFQSNTHAAYSNVLPISKRWGSEGRGKSRYQYPRHVKVYLELGIGKSLP